MVLKHSIPRLRFKEYNDQYESIILGDHTAWSSGGTPPKDNPDYWNGDIPWISASSMRGNFYSDSELKLSSNGVKKGSKIAIEGSLLILVRGSMLFNCIPIGIVGRDLAFNQDVKSIFPSEILDNWFLLYWFKSHEPQLMNIVSGTGIGAGKLDLSDLKGLKLYIPSVKEQKKIASFLSAVDDKIQLLKKQQAHLELYKKGVMQKIFSRELRFKDENGKNFPGWKELTLKDVVAKQSSNISANNIELNFGDYIIYGASGILKKIDFYEIESDYISIVKDGAGVGRLLYCKGKSSVLGTLDILSPILSKVDARYIYYLLSTVDFTKYVTGSTIPHIYFRDYQKERIQIPVKEEQQKIASFLSALDEKIDHCKEQIRLTEEWKKGLLQQMFV